MARWVYLRHSEGSPVFRKIEWNDVAVILMMRGEDASLGDPGNYLFGRVLNGDTGLHYPGIRQLGILGAPPGHSTIYHLVADLERERWSRGSAIIAKTYVEDCDAFVDTRHAHWLRPRGNGLWRVGFDADECVPVTEYEVSGLHVETEKEFKSALR